MTLAAIEVRPEGPGEAVLIRALTDAAFAPSLEEGRIVDALRGSSAWRPALSLVAVDRTAAVIVGHCVTSVGRLDAPDGTTRPILALGPISVLPARQGQGIGGALIGATVAQATADGWPVIVLLGHPTYYPRFGFESARGLGIDPAGRLAGRGVDGPPAADLVRGPARRHALSGGLRHRLTSIVRVTPVWDDVPLNDSTIRPAGAWAPAGAT